MSFAVFEEYIPTAIHDKQKKKGKAKTISPVSQNSNTSPKAILPEKRKAESQTNEEVRKPKSISFIVVLLVLLAVFA